MSVGKGTPPASKALSLAWFQGGPHGSRGGSSGSNGVSGPGPAQTAAAPHPSPLLLQGGEGEKGEGGRGEERRRGRGTAGGREGGGENAEVLKGTLTSFLGFPWQPNIPQMNISVREREEMEGGNGGRWRQRWSEVEAGRWGGGRKRDGPREMEGNDLETQMEG